MKAIEKNILLEIEQIIEDIITEKDLKYLAIDFLHKNKLKFMDDKKKKIRFPKIGGFIYFINALSFIGQISKLDWNFLCLVHNNYRIFINLQIHLDKLSIDSILKRTINFIEYELKHGNYECGIKDLHDFTIEFYKYIFELEKYQYLYNIKEIGEYKHLLISTRYKSKIYNKIEFKNNTDLVKNICSDFPINSKYSNMITILRIEKSCSVSNNFNINTDNKLIKNTLHDFFKHVEKLLSTYCYKFSFFANYFVDAFYENLPNSLMDFNDEIFRRQFNLFREIDSKYLSLVNKGKSVSTTILLIYFYRFLVNKSNIEGNSIGLSKQLRSAIEIRTFIKYYSKGYEFVYYNQIDERPLSDRVCLLPTPQSMNNANIKNSIPKFYDVSSLSNKYKEDVKEFIWKTDMNFLQLMGNLNYLKMFINIKEDFDKNVSNIKSLHKTSNVEFDDEFLYYYRNILELEYSNNMIKNILKIIRKYLSYFKDKYNLKNSHFQILTLGKLYSSSEVRVMTDNDVEVIYSEFEKLENESSIKRLQTIVFEIFIHTNIRIGSILNLTRNCLTYNDDGSVTLEYLAKTSDQEYVRQLINPPIVNLIEEALSITNQFIDVSNKDKLSKYIFIHKDRNTFRYLLVRLDFYQYFKKIIKSVSEKLDFKDYYPYNIRHTYINNVFKNGNKIGLNISEMAAISGISYKTANRYYRNLNDQEAIELYVETLSKVRLNNVSIDGEIIYSNDNKQTPNRRPVKDDLGDCRLEGCNYEISECLCCNNFVTFTNRIPNFKKQIINCELKIKESENPLIKEFYINQKSLLAAYLCEMMKLDNKGGK